MLDLHMGCRPGVPRLRESQGPSSLGPLIKLKKNKDIRREEICLFLDLMGLL